MIVLTPDKEFKLILNEKMLRAIIDYLERSDFDKRFADMIIEFIGNGASSDQVKNAINYYLNNKSEKMFYVCIHDKRILESPTAKYIMNAIMDIVGYEIPKEAIDYNEYSVITPGCVSGCYWMNNFYELSREIDAYELVKVVDTFVSGAKSDA